MPSPFMDILNQRKSPKALGGSTGMNDGNPWGGLTFPAADGTSSLPTGGFRRMYQSPFEQGSDTGSGYGTQQTSEMGYGPMSSGMRNTMGLGFNAAKTLGGFLGAAPMGPIGLMTAMPSIMSMIAQWAGVPTV